MAQCRQLGGCPKGKAVVTGAGSGIGAAFALELAARGGRVVCSDIDENTAAATAAEITAAGGEATVLRCDVSRIEDVQALADDAQSWFGGPPTLVINNAGAPRSARPAYRTGIGCSE